MKDKPPIRAPERSQRHRRTAQQRHSTEGALLAVRALVDPEFFKTIDDIRQRFRISPTPYSRDELKELPDNYTAIARIYRWLPRPLFPSGMTIKGASHLTPWEAFLALACWHTFSLEDVHFVWHLHEPYIPSPIMLEDPLPALVRDVMIKDIEALLMSSLLADRDPETWSDQEMAVAERLSQLERFMGKPGAYYRHIMRQYLVDPRPAMLFLYPWLSADDVREAVQRFEMPRSDRWTADDVWTAFIAYAAIAKRIDRSTDDLANKIKQLRRRLKTLDSESPYNLPDSRYFRKIGRQLPWWPRISQIPPLD